MDLLAQLSASLRATQPVVDAVKPDQLEETTPCTEWDVRALLGHMVGVNRMFATAARGEAPERPPADFDPLGDDPAGAYRASAEAAIEAVGRPGLLESTLHLPFGELPARFGLGLHFLDNLIHRWDLATATGQDPGIDPEVATLALELMQANMAPMKPEDVRGPGKVFALEVAWPDDAPAVERLIAFSGRHPRAGA